MKRISPRSGLFGNGRSELFQRWRRHKDIIARWAIALGGVTVIWAVVLIMFYLLYVVAPLFAGAGMEVASSGQRAAWADQDTVFLAVEEQLQTGLRVDRSGNAEFFDLENLAGSASMALLDADGDLVSVASDASQGDGLVGLGLQGGSFAVFRHDYEIDFTAGVAQRTIVPRIEWPYGTGARELLDSGPVLTLALSESDTDLFVAAGGIGEISIERALKSENFLTGETRLDWSRQSTAIDFEPSAMAISGNHRWLYAADKRGRIHRFDLPQLEVSQVVEIGPHSITSMRMLLGGISVLAGDEAGGLTQLFPVRDENNDHQLTVVRSFPAMGAAIRMILPEQRRKGFLVIDETGDLGVYHSTAGRRVLERKLEGGLPLAAALSPRANGLLLFGDGGRTDLLRIDNAHPELSFTALWSKVWYENYDAPEYVWQSSSASNDFEPKFSLAPLAFGTLKAAFYAMMFAVPLALMGAIYTAYFMAPRLRKAVKPAIEIMAALPTVILGFLAGLWFAPFIEENLAGIFSMLFCLPIGLFLFAWAWSHYDGPLKQRVADGWEPVLLAPLMVLLVLFSLGIADPLQSLFFGGDMRAWISRDLGVSYDQRNALVVGVAMGFAVIPTIFSIAEDALFGVPASLSDGSLALGATRWQTMARVILPTASPGVFSGLMIGFGRAVGETMIVLMATGNTPIMDWNMFEGMRTFAANIAVEMPESEVDGTHYRILFLAALILFIFTFVLNTGAEIVRQRLRAKYSSL